MKRRAAVLGVALSLTASGCAITTRLVPVEGPMSAVRPVPIIEARAERGGKRRLTFVLPDGDRCEGRWSAVGGSGTVSVAAGTLLSQYGAQYLSGYSVSSGSGQYRGQALVVCHNGDIFQIEFLSGSSGGFGIAKDREDNIYRFVF